jgi:hypothetical protein
MTLFVHGHEHDIVFGGSLSGDALVCSLESCLD